MNVNGATAAMLTAIDKSSFKAGGSEGQYFNVHLSDSKNYTVKITSKGDVSVNRYTGHMTKFDRVKNAVADFFSRGSTAGESAFTTRATQIKAGIQDLQQKAHQQIVSDVVKEAFAQPLSEFKNVAGYLDWPSGLDITLASVEDIKTSNLERLGFKYFTESDVEFIEDNFPEFINIKDALFGAITDRYIAAAAKANPDDLAVLADYYNVTLKGDAETEFRTEILNTLDIIVGKKIEADDALVAEQKAKINVANAALKAENGETEQVIKAQDDENRVRFGDEPKEQFGYFSEDSSEGDEPSWHEAHSKRKVPHEPF